MPKYLFENAGTRFISLILVLISLCTAGLNGQTAITTINATTATSTGSTKNVTSPSDATGGISTSKNYTVTYGTGSLEPLASFVVGGNTFDTLIKPDTVIVKRESPSDEQLSIFYARTAYNNAPTPGTIGIETTGPVAADALYLLNTLNAGLYNMLSNDDDVSAGFEVETERIDYIWFEGIQTTDPDESAFPIFDLGGDDNVAIAAITAIDASGNPTAYGQLVGIGKSSWSGGSLSIGDITAFRQESAALDNIPTENIAAVSVEGFAVTFDDLGIAANTNFYGYSLFAPDVVNGFVSGASLTAGSHTPAGGITLTDISTFPDNTKRSDAGIDLVMSGAAGAVGDIIFETVGPGGYKAALTTWLKANEGVTTATEGATVNLWEDQTVNNYNYTNLGTGPTYRSTTNTINFNPSIDFLSGSERGLQTPDSDDLNLATAYTNKSLTMAFRTSTTNISTKQQLYEQGGGTNGLGLYIRNGDLHLSVWNRGSGTGGDWNDNAAGVITVSSAVAVNTEYIVTLEFAGDGSGADNGSITAYLNGKLMGSVTDPYGQGVGLLRRHTGDTGLGQHDGASAYDDGFAEGDSFYGVISEFIYCNEPTGFTAIQRQKMNSYLAIKYGITLDQSTPYNYVNSEEAIVFDATSAAAIGGFLEYNKDIAGLGRDDASELLQLKSRSENANSIVTFERIGTIGTNDTWLIWGNDAVATTETAAASMPDTIDMRIGRVWRVAEKNEVGITSVTFDLDELGLTGKTANELGLLIAGNGTGADFSTATVVTGGLISGTDITFSGVDIDDGEFFTLSTEYFTCSPGGVETDLYVWLRADNKAYNTGTTQATNNQTVATWVNQQGGSNAVTDGNPPTFRNNTTDNINFNPTLDFDGTNDRLSLGNLTNIKTGGPNAGDYTLIGLGLRHTSGNTQYVLGSEGGTTNQDLHFGYRNNTAATIAHWGNDLDVTVNAFDSPENPFLLLAEYDGSNRYIEETRGGNFARSAFEAETTDLSGTKTNYVGDVASLGNYNGLISEIVIYDNDITDLQKQQVLSYLSIKYGVTLTNDNDNDATTGETISGAVTEGDYVSSDGTTILWDFSANEDYHNDIAGIGRDDRSCFNQTQSQSENSGSILTMGLGTIATDNGSNANTFGDDKDYLVWGNDGAATAQASANTSDVPGIVTERIERIWKAQDTGLVGATQITFDLTGLGYSTTLSNYILIVSSSATMASGTLTNAAGYDLSTNTVTFNDIDLTNGQFFTLGTMRQACGPAGVPSGLQLWLQGNSGTNTLVDGDDITTWGDQSGALNNVAEVNQGGTPEEPTFQTNVINFNPTVRFTDPGTSSNSYLETSANLVSDDMTLISVFSTTQTDGSTEFWSSPALIGGESGGTVADYALGLSGGRLHAKLAEGNGLGVRSPVSPVYSDGIPHIATATRVKAASGAVELYIDAQNIASGTSDDVSLDEATEIGIGNHADPITGAQFEGDIPEVIVYNSVLSADDRTRIEAYLAVKYGITRSIADGDDLGTAGFDERDYRRADGTKIWDYDTQGATYYNDIAGIGRDDASCFTQKQSSSINTDDIVTIGLGAIAVDNAANVNAFADDGDFLIWGNDNAATNDAGKEISDVPGNVSERMKRIWKVQDTGNAGATEIQFDLTGTGFNIDLVNQPDYSLLVSNTATMADAAVIAGGTFNGNLLSFTGVDLTDGQFFTIGTDYSTCGPGGVNTDIALWLAGDKETFSDAGSTAAVNLATLQQWNDQSAPASNASEIDLGGGVAAVLPVYRTEELNFNPAIRFADPNSTNASYMRNTTAPPTGDFTLISLFKTGQSDGTTNDFVNSPALLGADDNGSTLDYGLGIQSGKVLINANNNSGTDAETAGAYNDDNAHIAVATRAGSALKIFVDSKDDATGTGTAAALNAPANIGVGNHSDPNINAQFSGDIAETIVFNKALNEVDRTKVESYLAIKYGITRVVTGLSEAAEDYLAGDGGIIWNIDTQGATYHNDIFGIGRDDLSCFSQQKSKSENSDALVTIDNNGSFGTNDSWLISGNDGAVLERINNKERPATIQSRLNREWKVQETGTVGTIKLSYDLSTVTGPSGVGTNNLNLTRLMVDDDGDFTNGGTTLIEPSAIDGTNDIVTFDVDFTSGQYYSLGSTEVDALPITLIAFGSRVTGDNNVEISWATAQEVNNSFYTIERSQAGINFETIGFKEGAGNSNSIIDYTFIDKEPLQGTAYYRLKQTDFNGEFDYTEVTRVFVDLNKDVDYKVIPNPVSRGENFKVNYPVSENQAVKLMISSANGTQNITQTATVTQAENQIEVGTAMLPKGLYIIRIVNKNLKQVTLKFIVK